MTADPLDVEVVRPPRPRNRAAKALGALLLLANKVRHDVRGYRTPRPFPVTELDRALEYGLRVADRWLAHLSDHRGEPLDVKGLRFLELGPGDDLVAGAALLSRGAAAYTAYDVHPLALRAPDALYERLGPGAERPRFVCAPRLADAGLEPGSVDVVVSQAAFEHFESPGELLGEVGRLAAPGASLVALVDLQTHSRGLRDADPLNIYRYGDRFWRLTRFDGSPNRLRPDDWTALLRDTGWGRVESVPVKVLDEAHVDAVRPHLAPRFREPGRRLGDLAVMLRASR